MTLSSMAPQATSAGSKGGLEDPLVILGEPSPVYQSFYGFKKKPFSLLPDPAFIYLGEKRGRTLETLRYGINTQVGFTLITGEVGCGKTTLINYLLQECGENFRIGMFNKIHPRTDRLVPWVLHAFGINGDGLTDGKCHQLFAEYVTGQYREGRRVLFIVDEAQNLSAKLLEELRMLTNINVYAHFFQVLLAGQPELTATLRLPELRQLTQRITVFQHLAPWDHDDTTRYIEHRTQLAGGKPGLFVPEAIRTVYEHSGGVPRLINLFCDLALLRGYEEKRLTVDADLVTEVALSRVEACFGNLPKSNRANFKEESGKDGPGGGTSIVQHGPARRVGLNRDAAEPVVARSVIAETETADKRLDAIGREIPTRKAVALRTPVFAERKRTLEEARNLLSRWLD
jgi:general secretion pathway protein A